MGVIQKQKIKGCTSFILATPWQDSQSSPAPTFPALPWFPSYTKPVSLTFHQAWKDPHVHPKIPFPLELTRSCFCCLQTKNLADTAFEGMCRRESLKTPHQRPIIHLTVFGIATTHTCLWEAPEPAVCCVSDEIPLEGPSLHLSPATKRIQFLFISSGEPSGLGIAVIITNHCHQISS